MELIGSGNIVGLIVLLIIIYIIFVILEHNYKPTDYLFECGEYRIIKSKRGYRLQYKSKRSILEVIQRKSPWKSIYIDFDNYDRLKIKIFNKELKSLEAERESLFGSIN